MRKALTCLAVLCLAGALSPAWAGTVYVPVVKSANGVTQSTEIFVSNSSTAARNFSTVFLKADTNGTVRQGTPGQTAVVGNGLLRLASGAPAGDSGLLEVNADAELGIAARLVSTSGNAVTEARLPVISSANALAAGRLVSLVGLERREGQAATDLFLVNLGTSAAQCEVKLFGAGGDQLVATTTVSVSPLSLRPFVDVLGLIGQASVSDVRAQASCNQSFYLFAAVAHQGGTRMSFLTPAASGQSTLTGPAGPESNRPLPAGTKLLYELNGQLLVPSRGHEVFEAHIPVPKALSLKRMVIELDFTVGPWNSHKPDGPHAIIWLYRNGTYRSSTIANVNVHGPKKNKIRMNQNIDLPGLADTLDQQYGVYETGHTYHFFYTYNAAEKKIQCVVTEGNRVVNNLEFAASAEHRTLTVGASGLDYVLGHRAGLHYEVPSYGWTYSNLRVAIEEY